MRKKQFFCFSFQFFFGFWAKNFSDFQPKNFRKLSKLPSACPEEHFVTLIFLKKFWIVLDLLQKPLAWFPNFYLRVQSKNCGKNSFFCFLSRIFSNFEQKLFRLSAKKLQKVFKTTYVSRGKVCDLVFFLSFQTFRIFCRNIWHGSQNSIYVSRVKIAEKTVFFCFLSRTFSNFEQKLFRLSAKKLQKVFKTTYVSRGKVCDLVFFKLSNVSDFLQKQLAWFSKFYLSVQSKNCGKNSFFCFLSRIFSNFEQKLFRLLAKKLQKDFKTTYVSRGKVCDLKIFSKVLNRFGFSAETFGMVLNFLSTCQE